MKKEIQKLPEQINTAQRPGDRVRKKPLPAPAIQEVTDARPEETVHARVTEDYTTITVTSSNGKKYRIAVPSGLKSHVPRVWTWDERKIKAADMLAQGVPIARIVADPSVGVTSRMTIYGWLEHPEFREHLEGLVLETGFATKRERIAGYKRVADALYSKIINEINSVPLNEKTIHSFLSGFQSVAKLIAQEKEELIEQQRVDMDQTVDANVKATSVHVDLDQLLQSKTSEEREQLEKEWNAVGDAIIRSLTGH